MSEESILILNMLREGKITAEQADSLLRAVRPNGTGPAPSAAPTPPTPPVPPVAAVEPDTAAMAAMQAKLAELQGKLGDLQGKLGAAQTTRSTDYASALAGKILDNLPKPDLDMSKINKAVDEAMRGLNSLKNDAVRTARTAARQATHEARKAGREGRRAIKFEFNFDLGSEPPTGRPENGEHQPEAALTSEETISWAGAEKLVLENNYGGITVVGVDMPAGTANATVTKTAWAETDPEARIVLQQVFLTHQVENGRCKVGIAAPRDASERLTVDYEIRVPRTVPVEVTTTYGDVTARGTSETLTVHSASGEIHVSEPWTETPGEAHLHSHSGDIRLSSWNAPSGSLTAETSSASIDLSDVTSETLTLTSRAGDINAKRVHAGALASLGIDQRRRFALGEHGENSRPYSHPERAGPDQEHAGGADSGGDGQRGCACSRRRRHAERQNDQRGCGCVGRRQPGDLPGDGQRRHGLDNPDGICRGVRRHDGQR